MNSTFPTSLRGFDRRVCNRRYGRGLQSESEFRPARVGLVTMDPLVLLTDVERATEEFLSAAAGFDPEITSRPSRLPGWTVGDVLTTPALTAPES